jgi:hypothetical protein
MQIIKMQKKVIKRTRSMKVLVCLASALKMYIGIYLQSPHGVTSQKTNIFMPLWPHMSI